MRTRILAVTEKLNNDSFHGAASTLDNFSPTKPLKLSWGKVAGTREDDTPTPRLWRCHHRVEGSDIEAWVAASNGLEVIAQTRQINGVSARANADLIIQAVNVYDRSGLLISELLHALEQCLDAGIPKWEAEQEADAVCRKVRRVMGI